MQDCTLLDVKAHLQDIITAAQAQKTDSFSYLCI